MLGVQLLAVLLFSLALSLAMPSPTEPFGRAPWFDHYPSLWESGIEHMRTQASPMEPDDGVKLIFVTVVGLIAVMTDLLVLGVNRPAWALAPPATLFLVPALGLGADTGVLSFLYIAAGYLAILVSEGLNSTARWPRGLARDSADGFGTATPVVWRAAAYLAAPALIGTVVLGIVLPTLTLPGLGIGNGPGGNGPLQLTDPTLDLRRNLNQPNDRVVIEYDTTAPAGTYLRLATLPQLTSAGWGSVQIRLTTGDQLPAVPGLREEPQERQRTNIRVLDFGSQYLPLPYAPRSFEADGDWRFDANSLIVVNADERRAGDLRQLSYQVESVDIAPQSDDLARANAGTPVDDNITGAIPRDLPASIIDLTRDITAEATTDAAKAAAIQAYLRGGRYTYSLEPLPGSGYQALENFLVRDRRGYCEQFAAAMAVMARVAGIPSRVSVGFLPGEKDGQSWKVSIRDMHAWPELYFADYGWVRFEPTPASVTGAAPLWTLQSQGSPGEEPTLNPTAAPSSTAPTETGAPTNAPTDAPAAEDPAAARALRRTLLGTGVGLLLLLVLAAPATIRVRRRASRLTAEGEAAERVEAAWAEIRDSVVDYGGQWPGGSPKTIGREVASRLEGEESATMGRVATLVERSRYARDFEDPGTADLPTMTTEIRQGLAGPASWRSKARALLLPRSLFRPGRRE